MFAVCVKTGIIFKMRNTFSMFPMGTEHLRHQLNHLFDNISEGDIKGFVFQHTVQKFNHPAPQKKIFSFAIPQPIRNPFNIYYNPIRRPF